MLTLKVTKKEVEIETPQEFVCGTVGVKCKVVFDDFWADHNKTIVLKRMSKNGVGPFKIPVVNMETELTIPWELMVDPGRFKIGAYGTKDDEVLPTLWSDSIRVVQGTTTDGLSPQPPTPTEYQTLIELATEAVNTAQSIRDDADNGEFNGEQGPQGVPGPDGYTPVKGVDYYTDADKAEMVDAVLAALPNGDEVSY